MLFFELNAGDKFTAKHAAKALPLTKVKARHMNVRAADVNDGHEYWIVNNAMDAKGRPQQIDFTVEVERIP